MRPPLGVPATLAILFFCIVTISDCITSAEAKTVRVAVFMPNATTDREDDYVMTSAKLPDMEMYITKFLPKADESKLHHMLVYICHERAPTDEKMFSQTGQRMWRDRDSKRREGGMCGDGDSMLVYAYAHGGKRFDMPNDVGYRAGGSKFRYVVAQIHYRVVVKEADSSGLWIELSSKRPAMFAGMFLGTGMPEIPPHRQKVVTTGSCKMAAASQRMTIFAFRVHTHDLGRRVAAWRTRGGEKITIIDHDPQRGQYFRNMRHIDLLPGDAINFQCEYNSMAKNHTTHCGSTHLDEMCNVYLMYHSAIPKDESCPGTVGGGDELPRALGAVIGAPDLDAGSHRLGQVTGATFSRSGELFVFHRADRTWGSDTFEGDALAKKFRSAIAHDTVLVFDGSGRLKRSFGKGETFLPHGIAADPDGGVWISDVGSHEVVKFDDAGRRLITLGTRFEPGSGEAHFCKPADIAVSANDGAVYVADGYCNARIVKFDAAGKFVAEFRHAFSIPHSIAIDSHDRLYVADRQNKRLMRLDSDGKELGSLPTPDGNLPFGISVGTDCLSADDRKTLRNAALDDGPTATPDPLVYLTTTNDAWTRGRLTVMLPSGQVLQQVGDADDRTEAGERLTDPHAVAVAPGCRSVVVPELSKRVARFTLTAPAVLAAAGRVQHLRTRLDAIESRLLAELTEAILRGRRAQGDQAYD